MEFEVCFICVSCHKAIIRVGADWRKELAGFDWLDSVREELGDIDSSLINNTIPYRTQNEVIIQVTEEYAFASGRFFDRGDVTVKVEQDLNKYAFLSYHVKRDSKNQAILEVTPTWLIDESDLLDSWRYKDYALVLPKL